MNAGSLRNIFLIVFVASTIFLLMLGARILSDIAAPVGGTETPELIPTSLDGSETPEIVPTHESGGSAEQPSSTISQTGTINESGALIGSILTSLTSLIGFVTTTVITWRKEKREASLADVERKKLETELEKSRLELEELKKNSKKKDARRSKK